jgi:hypothetical protein
MSAVDLSPEALERLAARLDECAAHMRDGHAVFIPTNAAAAAAALRALVAAPARQPDGLRMPPGAKGFANAGVMLAVLPHATPEHLRDMAAWLEREAASASGKP